MEMILLFTILTVVNVIIQTVKSLCTVRCSTLVSASVNAVAYGLYTFVIFFTTAGGMALWLKAVITAVANFFGVYIANYLFSKLFAKEVRWKVEISIPKEEAEQFKRDLSANNLDYYNCGSFENWTALAIFCPDKKASECLRELLPDNVKYNIVESVKRL